ncbi:hypothetical protein EJB05_10437 [Eragrostis curvula]|uniref:Uncharacterized protein n=1 Tax=Eragrostis curvula TaxID=38414 RepID=A0A5J9VLM3_9POAL|nr:hypothetical protein EJB05_10437 [Eragrostis curvula]
MDAARGQIGGKERLGTPIRTCSGHNGQEHCQFLKGSFGYGFQLPERGGFRADQPALFGAGPHPEAAFG